MRARAQATPALAELHARDVAAGVDPLAATRAPDQPAPRAPGPPLIIEPPPWSVNYRPPVVVEEDVESRPAKKAVKKREEPAAKPEPAEPPEDAPSSTPNLDKVRGWLRKNPA